jgi:integrase
LHGRRQRNFGAALKPHIDATAIALLGLTGATDPAVAQSLDWLRQARVGFDCVDFPVLRRTHASLMRELGVDPKLVADQQGHTLDVNLNV